MFVIRSGTTENKVRKHSQSHLLHSLLHRFSDYAVDVCFELPPNESCYDSNAQPPVNVSATTGIITFSKDFKEGPTLQTFPAIHRCFLYPSTKLFYER